MKNISTRIFDHTTLKEPVRQGSLLVAEPFLRESWFLHSVVSMVNYPGPEGPMGIVLNNPTSLLLSDVLDEVAPETAVPLHCGGPLSDNRLFFIHTLGESIIPEAYEYAPGLFIGGDFDSIISYVNDGYPIDGVVRFFLGYSGWGVGQLQSELDGDVWAVGNVPSISPAELLTLDGDSLWHRVVKALGTHYRTWQLHPAQLLAN